MSKVNVLTSLLILGSLLSFICFQLFVQAPLVEANYIKLKETYRHHSHDVWEVKFSPDDALMLSAGIEEDVMLWSRISGEVLQRFPHEIGAPACDFSPDGKRIVTGAYDGKLRLWDVETGALLEIFGEIGGTIWSVDFSPNGQLIAAGGDDDNVKVWNVETGRLVHNLKEAKKNIWEVLFNPSGDLLLSSGSDNTIRVYDTKSGQLLHQLHGHTMVPLAMDFSPDGDLLASAGDDKTIKIWDTSTWDLIHSLRGHNEELHSVVFIDNHRVLAGGTDKRMFGELLEYHFAYKGMVQPINATLWDVQKGVILQTLSDHTDDIGLGMDVNTDGTLLASPSKDKTIKIWSL